MNEDEEFDLKEWLFDYEVKEIAIHSHYPPIYTTEEEED
jgi:hypothetical protein